MEKRPRTDARCSRTRCVFFFVFRTGDSPAACKAGLFSLQMGRGEGTADSKAPRRAPRGALPEFFAGQRWRSPEGRELTITGAAREWGHRALTGRSEFGPLLIDPELLASRYEMIEQGAGPAIDTAIPEPRSAKPAPDAARKAAEPMTEPQAKFLRELCAQHGREFDPALSKKQASRLIGQLKSQPIAVKA